MRIGGACLRAILLFFVVTTTAHAAALQSDDFEADNEGWGRSAGGSIPWATVADGGPAGAGDAFLQITSGSFGDSANLAAINATSDWTGDFLGIGATRVAVDLMADAQSDPVDMRLILFGPDSNGQRWTTNDVAQVPNDGVWRTYEFSLLESDLMRVQGTSEYADVMSGVLQLMIRHNPLPSGNGVAVNALVGMDNIRLVPEPTSIALLVTSCFGFYASGSRRRAAKS